MGSIVRTATGFAAALGFALVSGAASASPIVIDQWYEFKFTGPGSALEACAGACTPGILSIEAGNPAWTFDCPTDHCKLIVTDGFIDVDQFELFDLGVSLGITSAPGNTGHSCGNDELGCLADPLMSHGVFILLGAGAHSITGLQTLGIPGAGFFIVTIPEPASLLLIGAGLLMLVGLRRRA